jgi:hypothetical protein
MGQPLLWACAGQVQVIGNKIHGPFKVKVNEQGDFLFTLHSRRML